jgi:hypothetical protein
MIALLSSSDLATPDQLFELHTIIHDWSERIGPLADRKFIANMIDQMAALFGSKMPERAGLEMYFQLLEEYPEALLRQAAREVARTHKWPRLPYPADFITVIETDWKHCHALLQNISTTYKLLQKRSDPP